MQNPDETQASVPGGGDSLDGIVLPTAYRINAERALARYPERAANYFRHTLIGDPPWDGILQELAPLPGPEVSRFIQAGMEQQEDVMRDAPRVLRNFFIDSPPPDPPWLDRDAFGPGRVRPSEECDSNPFPFVPVSYWMGLPPYTLIYANRPDIRQRRVAVEAEQPPPGGDLLPWRPGEIWGWLEAVRADTDRSRPDQASAGGQRGVGCGRAGRPGKRRPPWLRGCLLRCAIDKALGSPGRQVHPGRARELSRGMALRGPPDGDTRHHTLHR